MQWLVIAYDGTDEHAMERRAAARPAHLEGAKVLKEQGHFITGGAILNNAGSMIGSMMLMEFADEPALQAWLQRDPYTVEKVWQKVEVRPFRIAALD